MALKNFFSDLFNPTKRIIVSPAKSNGVYGLKMNTTTTIPKQQIGSSQPTLIKSQPSQPTKPSALYGAITAPMNEAQRQQKLIQSYVKSGIGAVQNKVEPSNPTPPPPPAPNMQGYYDEAKARQDKIAADKYASDVAYNNSAYDNLETGIKGRLSNAEGYLKDYETGTAADIAAEQDAANKSKLAKEQEYGQNQRTMMQQRQQQKGALEKQYAALGTIDSYGSGSFTGANTNLETEFGRMSNQNLMQKQNAIDSIDANFSKYERTVKQAIQLERSKFNDKVLEINTTLAGNAIERKKALDTAYNELKTTEANLQDTWEGLKMQLEQDKYTASNDLYKSQQEAKLMEDDMKKLRESGEGVFNGKQATMNDFIIAKKYGIANPADLVAMSKENVANAPKAGDSQKKGLVLGQINRILASDTKPITGFNRIVLPGTSAATTQADWEGLKNLLSLAKRGELKGSGQVSDFEQRMLEKAALAGIDPTMDDATFRKRLTQLRDDMLSEGTQSTTGGTVQMQSPDGKIYTVDQSEYQSAISNGWKPA